MRGASSLASEDAAFYAKTQTHTELDTYEKVLPFRTAQQYSAVVMVLIAYEIANAPEVLSTQGYYLLVANQKP